MRHHLHGIIPAYAGNTQCLSRLRKSRRDHPRVCGEHPGYGGNLDLNKGSSPRMRGTPWINQIRVCNAGIIPAYAGNTIENNDAKWPNRDHPRVCGEHLTTDCLGTLLTGSSPRMRGTPATTIFHYGSAGIIPAYAGNTPKPYPLPRRARDHPRVCGEHQFSNVHVRQQRGSSPRMRGTPCDVGLAKTLSGIIPAYAGNTHRYCRT